MKKLLMVFVVLGILTGCGSKTETRTLVVSTWGLNEDHLMNDVIKPFEEKFNAKVVLETGSTTERFTKLKDNPNSTVDVIELSQTAATDAYELGLVDKIDRAKIPNMDALIDGAQDLAKNGYGPAYVVNSIGIIYNPTTVTTPLNEWDDLWSEGLKGRIAIPDIATTFGPAVVSLAGDVAKTPVTVDRGAAAFEKLEALKPNIVKTYAKSSDLAVMFASGEIDAAIVGDFAYDVIKKGTPEVVYTVPQSGTYANFNTMDIATQSKNKDLAYEFINFRLDQETQAKTAVSLNEAPVNKNVTLSEEAKGNKTYGPIAERARALDYSVINPLMPEWIDAFNRIMNH